MTASEPFQFVFRGQPAEMRVLRNSGHCWGRISAPGSKLDVEADIDIYDLSDAAAAEIFILMSATPGNVQEATAWLHI
jgi:hypothetical protein